MTDTDRPDQVKATETDDRSDIEQAVSARSDALARGESESEPDASAGEGGADGVVKNQDRDLGQ